MTTYDDWVNALEFHGCRPKRQGRGVKAMCPAHEDRQPSLSVDPAEDGGGLVYCFAGCDWKVIKDALGLTDGPVTVRNTPAPPRAPKPPPPPPKPTDLPSGPRVTHYPYDNAAGERVMVVVRIDQPEGGKRISQWTPDGKGQWLPVGIPDNRPLYRLRELPPDGTVVVVEGEKCVEAVRRAWPTQAVTCWPGGGEAWKLTDWTPLAGRAVSLLADTDKAGRKTMTEIAQLLAGLGCTIKLGLPEGEDKSDIYDWLAEDPAGARERVASLLKPYEPPPESRLIPDTIGELLREDDAKTANDPEPDDDGDTLGDNLHYRLLGLDGDAVAVRIAAGRILHHTRVSMTSPNTLISLAPLTWWSAITGQEMEALTPKVAQALGDALLREADRLGQVDLSTIRGRGAVRLSDGSVAYHLGDRVLLNGEEVPLNRNGVWLAEPHVDLAEPATDVQMQAIARAVLSYRWAEQDDGKRMLGWIVAALVGGALPWRPHLMLTAPAAVGKSWFIAEVVERLMGPLMYKIADATPAALARLTAVNSLPIVVDEAEASSPWVIELVKLLRISSGAAGMRVRADNTTGGVVTQQPRFAAMLSNTAAPLLQRADSSRMTVVRFGKPVDDWPAVLTTLMLTLENADRARARIVRSAQQVVDTAHLLTQEYQGLGMDSRDAMASAALGAGWRAWCVDKSDVFSQHEKPEQADAADAVLEILSIRMRLEGGVEKSLLELLMAGMERQVADLYGVRFQDDALLIAPKHHGLMAALARTQLGQVDLRRLLLQVDGAEYTPNPQRFGVWRARAVAIPPKTLADLGIGEAL